MDKLQFWYSKVKCFFICVLKGGAIKLVETPSISMEKFSIKSSPQNRIILTNGDWINNLNNPMGGGIKVAFPLKVKSSVNGRLIVSQVCTHHLLDIKLKSGKHERFKNEEPLKDSETSLNKYIKFYNISAGVIKDSVGSEVSEIQFDDKLVFELFDDWDYLKYEINFETWFQFESENKIIPIFSIDWHLSAECKFDLVKNQWNIEAGSFSLKNK